MAIRSCKIVAIEGTQTSGKSTLGHALVAYWRERGVHTAFVEESARTSPLVEEVLLGARSSPDLTCEIDLFAAQLTTQVRAARLHRLVIADKTIANVIAYCQAVMPDPTAAERAVISAMKLFCQAWATSYDAIILCQDRYDQHLESEIYIHPLFAYQTAVGECLEGVLAELERPIIRLPLGMTTTERLSFAVAGLEELGISSQTLAKV